MPLAGRVLSDKILFVKNAIWKNFWREFFSYWHYFALGMLLSQFPFLFMIKHHIANGSVVRGFFSNLFFGLIICSTIWIFLLFFYGIRTHIHLKTGQPVEVSQLVFFSFISFAGLLGICLAILIRDLYSGVRSNFDVFFYSFLIAGVFGVIFYFYHAYQRAKEKSLANEAALSEARYQTLEHQMRPHFLFNALNSLAELIESKEETAAEMTYKLSDLYRQILQNSKTKTSSLKSEVEIARGYLELEKLRLGNRLEFSFDVTDEEIYLPSLMLQTLVENAVKHGVAKSVVGGRVSISITEENNLYSLTVSNTGEPFKLNSIEGNGLANTKERLNLLYNEQHKFKIETNGEKTVATFFFTGEKID